MRRASYVYMYNDQYMHFTLETPIVESELRNANLV